MPDGEVIRRRPGRSGLIIAAAVVATGVLLALTVGLGVALSAVLLLSIASVAPRARGVDWPGFWRWWRLQTRPMGKGTAIASINAVWPALRRLLRPDHLFVTYPGTERHKRLYFPPWVERTLRPVFPSGVIRFGRYWGLIVSGVATAETLESSPERMRALLDETRDQFPGIEVIALAGRLPGVAEKTGVGLEPPFIHGNRGAVCAMVGAARELARLLGKPPAEVTVGLVGGGGFIGSRLLASLSGEFARVIALDSRFAGDPSEDRGVRYTDRPEDLVEAEAVVVLTARGTDTATMAQHLAPEAVVADDTHPEIPLAIRTAMEQRGATVLKAAMADERIRIVPRIPTFRADDIPGCLLEALVVVQRGSEVLETQQGFNEAAAELGFRARLAPHLNPT